MKEKNIDYRSILILCFVVFGSFKLFAQGVSPILSNFRIENSNKSRVYFDSSESISGSSTKGFKISGKKVSGIKINTGSKKGHYISVSGSFDFWENNTIRFEGGNNIQSKNGASLKKFTLQYIKNNIPEPDSKGRIYYVSINGSDSKTGLSKTKAWRTISYAAKNARAGDIVYIEAGDYGKETVVVKNSGNDVNPIKFIGYKKNPGDHPSLTRSQTTKFSSSQMPLIHTKSEKGSGFSMNDKKYIIVRNIQIEGFDIPINMGGSSYCILDNIYVKGGHENIKDHPYYNSIQNRVINSYTSNASKNGIFMAGARFLIDNVYASSKGTPSMDYYIVLVGGEVGPGEHIIRNCEVVRDVKDTHAGHGISLKAQTRDIEYSLIEDCLIHNVSQAVELRHSQVRNNVVRNVRATGDRNENSNLITFRDDTSYNIVENCYADGVYSGIKFNMSKKEEKGIQAGGHHNKVINTVFNNCKYNIIVKGVDRAKPLKSTYNEFINCTFFEGEFMFDGTEDFNKTNSFTNCIISGTSKKSKSGSFNPNYSNCNFFKTFTKENGNGNISVDPKFENSANGKFNLKSDSPLIDKGKTLDYIDTDFDGNPRHQGSGTDIGAFEFQDSSTSTINADAGEDVEICKGEEVELKASGGGSYDWSSGQKIARIKVSPTKTTTYKVKVSSGKISDEAEVTVTVNEVQADAGKDVTINEGEEVTLTASGGDTYLWTTGETTASITVSPKESKNYKVTVGSNGCEDTDKVRVNVEAKVPPVTAVISKDISICTGESVTLTASGGDSYSWDTGASASEITVNPEKTTTYTVSVTDGITTDEAEVTVTVNEVQADAGKDVTINEGEEVTLTASGGDTYQWTTGENTASITISPKESKNYKVTVSSNGCEDTDKVRVNVEAKVPPVTAVISKDISICTGESVALTASGGDSYSWSTGASSSEITVNPEKTTTYTVSVTDGITTDEAEVIVTVNEVNASAGDDVTINEGEEVTLTASGGDTYQWTTGENTASITVSPKESKNYKVTVVSNGCEDTDGVRVNVEAKVPPVTAEISKDISICLGESVALTASGGDSYSWSTGASSSEITVNPEKTTTYTVSVTDGITTDEGEVIVTVNEVNASAGADVTINSGESVTLTASGGDSYLWDNGETTASITVDPSATTTYTVTVTKNGCEATDEVKVELNTPSPPVVIANAGENQTICLGEEVTLTASGGSSYSWSNGSTTASITFNPEETKSYTVTVSDGNTTDKDQVTVTVDQVEANAGQDQTITEGEEVTLTASGGDTYLWSSGETTASITVNPTQTTTYIVTSSKGSCSDTDQVQVSVNQTSQPAVVANAGDDQEICLGDEITLQASGGKTYKWNNGETTAIIKVSPSESMTYSVEVSDGISYDTADVTITVNEVNAYAGEDVNIQEGESVKLTAKGGDTFLWSNGENSKNILVSPHITTIYEVEVEKNGCIAYDEVKVKVDPLSNSNIQAFAGNDVSTCFGEKIILTASGGGSYKWSTGETTKSISVSPKSTKAYTVEVSNGIASDIDEVVVEINNIQAEIGENTAILEGESITLTAKGGDTYLWNNGETSESIVVSPKETSIYSVTAFKNGCQDSDSVQITVNKVNNEDTLAPIANAGEDVTICLGESTILKGSGGESYLWSTGDTEKSVKVSPKRTTTYTIEVLRGGITLADEVTVYVDECKNLDDDFLTLKMIVYPNPSNGMVNMNISGARNDLDMVLFDINGRVVHSENVNSSEQNINKQLDLSRLPKGVYLVHLSNSNQSFVSKILLV